MTKENKFYLWLVVGLVVVGVGAWWYTKNKGSLTGAPDGAKLSPT